MNNTRAALHFLYYAIGKENTEYKKTTVHYCCN